MPTAFKQVTDNAFSLTTTNLSTTGITSLVLQAALGARFPQPGNGFIVTLWDNTTYPNDPFSDPNMEKVICTGRSTDTLTITATTKVHLSTGTMVALLDVASNTTDLQTAVNAAETTIASQATAIAGKEPTISPGLTSQYWRGDKSWQTLTTAVVTENTNLYYTNARADARIALQAGAPNGLAQLDGGGKVPTSQLPNSVLGALEYQGTYDASGGSFPASPSKGYYYVISVAGTLGGVAYKVGDWLTYDGTGWDKIDNGQTVSSVAGRTGAIVLAESDITNLTTDLAAKASLSAPAFTGVPTAPTAAALTNNTQIATTAYADASSAAAATAAIGADTLHVLKAGDTMTGQLILAPSTTTMSSLRVPAGVSPTSGQVNGDMYYNGGLHMWIAGADNFMTSSTNTQTFFNKTFGSDILPSATLARSVGSSGLYFQHVYSSRYDLNSTTYIDGATSGVLNVVTSGAAANQFTFTETGAGDATLQVVASGTTKASFINLKASRTDFVSLSGFNGSTKLWSVGRNGISAGLGIYTGTAGGVLAGTFDDSQNLVLVGNYLPSVTATSAIGTTSLYFTNSYITRLNLNSTAYWDGGVAGAIGTLAAVSITPSTAGATPLTATVPNSTGQNAVTLSTATGAVGDSVYVGFLSRSRIGYHNGSVVVDDGRNAFGGTGEGTTSSKAFSIWLFGQNTLLQNATGTTFGLTATDTQLPNPTHTFTLASTATGLSSYNTTDQTTNYERVVQSWITNVYTIATDNGGTGTVRNLSIGSKNRRLLFNEGGGASGYYQLGSGVGGTTNASIINVNGTFTNSAGIITTFGLQPTMNQTGTAGYTMLLVNPTITAVGSGPQLLADFQVGGVSQLSISSAAVITLADSASIVTGTTTGLTIGTSTTQKVGFYGVTPLGQQANTQDLGTVLANSGFRAVGANYTLSTSGTVSFSGGFKTSFSSRTANTTLATTSAFGSLCDATTASFTVTLPVATGNQNVQYLIEKIDSTTNTVTVKGNGTDLINGSNTYVLSTQYKYVWIVSNGTQWYVVGNN